MTTHDEHFWYEHELCRLRASQRAGANVAKEMATVNRRLDAIAAAREEVTVAVKRADDVLPTDWTKP